jgi:hypothetical protein
MYCILDMLRKILRRGSTKLYNPRANNSRRKRRDNLWWRERYNNEDDKKQRADLEGETEKRDAVSGGGNPFQKNNP